MTDTNYPSASTSPQNQPVKKNNFKNLAIGILSAALLGTWGYHLYEVNKAEKKENDQLVTISKGTTDFNNLQTDFNEALARLDSITGANNGLQGEKSNLQKDIESKKAQIRKILRDKNATEADLAKAKTMIGELNDKINGLAEEVTRLTGENQVLTTSNTSLKEEKTNLEQNLQTTKTQKEDLEKTVDVASTFSASNIQVVPIEVKKSGKVKNTTTAKRVDKLVVSFDVENRIAKSGPADMYLIVTAPDGKIISVGDGGVLNTRTDGDKTFTAKLPVEYEQGQRKNVQFPILQNDFLIGDYKVEIYHNGFKIGEGVRSLKKGGLFS